MDDLISVTLTRSQWEALDRQASLYLGAACCDDPALEAIRAAIEAVPLKAADEKDSAQ